MKNETKELYERRVEELLDVLGNMNNDTPESQREYQQILSAIDILSDKLASFQKNDIEEEDKREKRRIEEEKNHSQTEVERSKQEIHWKKVTFEMAKVLGPTVVGGMIFGGIHRTMMRFEETGRINSSSGRSFTNLVNRFLKF